MGAEGAGHPLDPSPLLDQRPLGVQIVHVFRPVLDRGIAQCRALLDKQFHTARMEVRHIVFWCGTALDKMQIRPLIHDDERVFKLPCSRRIEPEIGLQRNRHRHARRHIDKRSS